MSDVDPTKEILRTYVAPKYVTEGDTVWAPYIVDGKNPKNSLVRCVVRTASGYRARVVNENHNFDRWVHIDDLRVQPT